MKRRYHTRPLPLRPSVGALYRGTSSDGRRFWFRIDHIDSEQVYLRRWQFVGQKREFLGAGRMTLEQWQDNVTQNRRAGK